MEHQGFSTPTAGYRWSREESRDRLIRAPLAGPSVARATCVEMVATPEDSSLRIGDLNPGGRTPARCHNASRDPILPTWAAMDVTAWWRSGGKSMVVLMPTSLHHDAVTPSAWNWRVGSNIGFAYPVDSAFLVARLRFETMQHAMANRSMCAIARCHKARRDDFFRGDLRPVLIRKDDSPRKLIVVCP